MVAPRATPRRAITDQFFDAAYDLTKVADRIGRLAGDDGFPQNAEKIAAPYEKSATTATPPRPSVRPCG